MERYYKRKSSSISSDNRIPNSSSPNLDSSNPISNNSHLIPNSSDPIGGNSTPQQNELKVDLDNLERDPGKRIPMKYYPLNIRDESEEAHMTYRTCLNTSIDCTKFLLRQSLSFRGHDKSDTSNNTGNYLELLQFLADHDEKIKAVVLDKASGNLKLIAHSIQNDLVHSYSIKTIKTIISDMKNARFFYLLVDEAHDVSINEQITAVLCYVDKNGKVIEMFVGVQHVPDTTSNTLKEFIDAFIHFNKLSFPNLRGQCYDCASNMKGEFNGLKTKILNDHPCAFYGYCFAYQLQLALVSVVKDNVDVNTFFLLANNVVNNIGVSCKQLMKTLENDSLITRRGLNQETNLKRAGVTRWNSNYCTLISLITMFSSVVNVLEMIVDNNTNDSVAEANKLLKDIQSFEFVFPYF
ncbi:unnamed protein product [Malus baccata var. baccata]